MPARSGTSAAQIVEAEMAVLVRRAEAVRRATPPEAPRALDRAAYVILRHLDEVGAVNVGALASALALDASTVTRQVTAMERDALVRRDRDPMDGRGTLITPTPAGNTRLRSVRRARAEHYERILADWTESDRHALATMLRRLNRSLESATRPAEMSRKA